MICPNCGKKTILDHQVCPSCAFDFSQEGEHNSALSSPVSPSREASTPTEIGLGQAGGASFVQNAIRAKKVGSVARGLGYIIEALAILSFILSIFLALEGSPSVPGLLLVSSLLLSLLLFAFGLVLTLLGHLLAITTDVSVSANRLISDHQKNQLLGM